MTTLRKLTILTLIISCALLLGSCNNEGEAQARLIIQSIDQINDPFGDVLNSNGVIPPDLVDITLLSLPINLNDGTSGTYGDILVDLINVTFTRLDGGTDVPAGFSIPVTLRVPISGTATIQNLPILPSTVKNTFPISDLITFGYERTTNFTSIRMQINIEISGKTLAEHPVVVTGTVVVELANYAD